MYGVAVFDLKLPPSEVLKMTVSEIQAVIWAATRNNGSSSDHLEELYTDYHEKGENNG
jgi:hypothetical protein